MIMVRSVLHVEDVARGPGGEGFCICTPEILLGEDLHDAATVLLYHTLYSTYTHTHTHILTVLR